MAATENFALPLPQMGEPADIRVLNRGTEEIDGIMNGNRTMFAPAWVNTETYHVGSRVVYLGEYYKCKADNVTGAWDATKWDKLTVGEDIEDSTGGASALADLDDVEITSPTDGQALVYDDTDDVWKNTTLPEPVDVEANPSASSTATLSKLKVGSTVYGVSGLPSTSSASNGDVLTLGSGKTPTWAAPAVGGDGVTIDTSTVITSGNIAEYGALNYTATQDCFVAFSVNPKSGYTTYIKINNVTIKSFYGNFGNSDGLPYEDCIFLKTGQALYVNNNANYQGNYHVYGVQEINSAVVAQLNAMKTGFDGVTYSSPAEQVIGSDTKLQDQITALPQNNYVNTIYGRSAYWDKPEGVLQTIQNGIINFKDGSTYTGGTTVHIEIPISSYVGQYIAVSGHSATVSSSVYYALCGIYDSSNNLLEMHGSSSSTTYEYLVFKVPTGASKIVVNGDSSYAPPTLYINNAIVSELLKPAFEYANSDKDDSGSHLFVYNEPEYVSGGLRNFKNNTSYGSSGGKKYTVSPGDLCIISGQTASVSSSVNYNLYGFYDSEMNLLSVYNGVGSTVYSNVQVIAPSNAAYCWVNGGSNKTALLNVRTSLDIKTYIDTHAGTPSIWAGKKIGVLGTSVAFGQLATTSYSYEAAQILGYDLKMFGLPGLAIQTNDDGTPKTYGSFTLSKSEYASAGWTLPDAPITPYVPGGSYNNYYRTYENVFVQENADIDLWVYAVIPNNGTFDLDDWNAFDKNQWKYSDNSSFADHRKTFLGALLFIMDQMYTLNPNARMILLVDSSFDYAGGLSNFETVAQQWKIPIVNLWGKINTSPKSIIQLKSEGGTNQHPSTFAHQIMGRMFSGDLGSLS